jgi:hypothetical protein
MFKVLKALVSASDISPELKFSKIALTSSVAGGSLPQIYLLFPVIRMRLFECNKGHIRVRTAEWHCTSLFDELLHFNLVMLTHLLHEIGNPPLAADGDATDLEILRS